MAGYSLRPMTSWQEFLDAARAPDTIPLGSGRHGTGTWPGAGWDEALRLAVDGWHVPLADADVTVGTLRERAGLGTTVTQLEPTWDVTGGEVDIGAYLSGVPECMIDAVPRQTSTRGRVVTFLIPATYSARTPHSSVHNRGLALATLCEAIIGSGHSVEIWSGYAAMVGPYESIRCSAVARVLSAGEPFDIGRLTFAVAHPAMCRRLWFGVWDGQPAQTADIVDRTNYGYPPFSCRAEDLPAEITAPYVFPHLEPEHRQWRTLESALDWCRGMFADLGLVRATAETT
jgi:hypothetical protein